MGVPLAPSFCYDAVSILGLGEASSELLPDPAPGEVVIRVGAWSLKELRNCEIVVRKNLMWEHNTWYDRYDWGRAKLTPGVYRMRMPIPDSGDKNFAEQQKLLLSGEEVAPVTLAATVFLCHLKETGKDLLANNWTRCAEPLPDELRVELTVLRGRVYASYDWTGYRYGYLWLSSACRI